MTRTSPKTKAGAASRRTKSRRKASPRASARSLVKPEYRARYRRHGGSCGDDLALRLRKHVATADGTIDVAKLRALAKANGVWQVRYSKFNAGMLRMACGNRLRALVRHGTKLVWPR